MSLYVVVRIYPRISKKPFFDFPSKLALVEANLRSLKRFLDGVDYRLDVIFDGCEAAYVQLAREIFGTRLGDLHELPGKGNWATFALQYRLATTQNFSDQVFLVEDDYLFLPGGAAKVLFLLASHPSIDFVTPHDHLDYYRLKEHAVLRPQTWLCEGQQYRSVVSTCMTFVARKAALLEAKSAFDTYGKANTDFGLWVMLTEPYRQGPRALFRMLCSKLYVKAFLRSALTSRHRLWSRRRFLLAAPRPGLGTHMQYDELGPGVDWLKALESD